MWEAEGGAQTGEILPGLHRVYQPYGDRALYQHLLTGEESVVLVDTGVHDTPEMVIVPYLERLHLAPETVRLAVISHADADHFGGNAQIRRFYRHCMIAAHASDSRWIEEPDRALRERYGEFEAYGLPLEPEQRNRLTHMMGPATPVDLRFTGGEAIRLGNRQIWQVLHVPGHSPGHLMLWNPGPRAAIICDAVLGEGIPSRDRSLNLCPTFRNTAAYLATIGQIEALHADWLLTSHFPVMRGKAVSEFLQDSRDWVRRVDAAILLALRMSQVPLRLGELIEQTAASLGDWHDPGRAGLQYPLLGGLELLEQRGVVCREGRAGVTRWRPIGDTQNENR